ncbi:hypothetical protein GCM10011492_05900 [Flexivirga endophytica]|uniref:Uncharacterized protein n=1 Tax=Flexivirga endophytica TaxID=1849103 RepID=A0A916SVT0_9MICO|nr:hypothetical protein GCM10011492_05900 [Flexivirga endophytica]GHB36806.1 hypothetical protein GCM10008112_01700 [Flexivirga endophytica]
MRIQGSIVRVHSDGVRPAGSSKPVAEATGAREQIDCETIVAMLNQPAFEVRKLTAILMRLQLGRRRPLQRHAILTHAHPFCSITTDTLYQQVDAS